VEKSATNTASPAIAASISSVIAFVIAALFLKNGVKSKHDLADSTTKKKEKKKTQQQLHTLSVSLNKMVNSEFVRIFRGSSTQRLTLLASRRIQKILLPKSQLPI